MHLHIFKRAVSVLIFIFATLSTIAATQKPNVMLGIDVLESNGFDVLANKRVGLLTHPAGVNRWGKSTIDVLRGAKNVRLTALFGPEHGIYGNEKADVPVLDKIDKRTGLPVFSLYGKYRKPTPEMLKKIDVMVVDLQDIGSRSYTYVSCMLRTMEACFENGKTVVVLDRPNPLGGQKVDGPILDLQYKSYVGMLKVPYVHGMTIGELARWAKGNEGALEITSKERRLGRLVVVPMRGWTRSMLWGDTNLRWVPTSPAIPSFAAAAGYAMTGLGCQLGGFQHGYGTAYPFRMLTFPSKLPNQIKAELARANIAGVSFSVIEAKDPRGKPMQGLYVQIKDWQKLRPTEISFYLMAITCKFNGGNIFRQATKAQSSLFNKHTGSEEWWNELCRSGANINVPYFIDKWEKQAIEFKAQSKKYWLYK